MGGIGWSEMLIVFCIVLLLFGVKRIPALARSFGKAKGEFKKAKDDILQERDELLADIPVKALKKNTQSSTSLSDSSFKANV